MAPVLYSGDRAKTAEPPGLIAALAGVSTKSTVGDTFMDSGWLNTSISIAAFSGAVVVLSVSRHSLCAGLGGSGRGGQNMHIHHIAREIVAAGRALAIWSLPPELVNGMENS